MSNVKKPSYVNCDSNTLIKNIPNIINTNNEENIKFFKSIFEFGGINNKSQTQQYIKVPLITKGIVKGGSGQFFNLYANNVTLSNDSMDKDFINIKTNHQKSINRFKNEYSDDIKNTYAHDAAYILYNDTTSLKTELDSVINKVNKLYLENNYDDAISDINERIRAIEDAIGKIIKNLNINTEYPQDVIEDDNNEELINTINSPTSSYTYSSNYYKK